MRGTVASRRASRELGASGFPGGDAEGAHRDRSGVLVDRDGRGVTGPDGVLLHGEAPFCRSPRRGGCWFAWRHPAYAYSPRSNSSGASFDYRFSGCGTYRLLFTTYHEIQDNRHSMRFCGTSLQLASSCLVSLGASVAERRAVAMAADSRLQTR